MIIKINMLLTNKCHRLIFLILILSVCSLSGCASLMQAATARFADNLNAVILNQDDTAIVRDGVPTFLLLIDAQIEGDQDNSKLLMTGARLYGAYASSFVTDEIRAKRMAGKSLEYARRALCITKKEICSAYRGAYDELLPLIDKTTKDDVEIIYDFAASWAGWVQANSDNWSAIADIPKIEAMMRRIVLLDERHDKGGAHLYLGVIASQLPPALGGKPELGRMHFEQAIELSDGRNFMAKVLFAESYARLMFDRELHDNLLNEVIASDPVEPGLTLINVLAIERANKLLISADDYF